jgi:3-isopropylmalate dehydrogenase
MAQAAAGFAPSLRSVLESRDSFPQEDWIVLKIAVISGDGIGPEVVREGLKVLEAVAQPTSLKCELTEFDWGGERWMKTGEVRPENALDLLREFDAIYLGAVGHPS